VGVRVSAPADTPSWDMTARFNPDGSNDLSFGQFGGTSTEVLLPADNGPVGDIDDYDLRVPDPFAPGVKAATVESPAAAAARQPDGKIVAVDIALTDGPSPRWHVAVLRFNADGTPDDTFAHSVVSPELASHLVAVQPGTGRILAAAGGGDFGVVALQSAPPLDAPRPVPAPDTVLPAAVFVSVRDVTDASQESVDIVVRYADMTALLDSSFDLADLRVTAPDGTPLTALAAVVEAGGDPATYTVTYTYRPPGGGFTPAMNGTYTVSIEPNQVFDVAGNAVLPVAALATFNVNLPPAEGPGVPPRGPDVPTNAPNLVAGPVTARLRRGGVVAAGSRRPLGRAWFTVTNAGDRPVAGPVAFTVVASADDHFDAGDTELASSTRRLVLRPNRSRLIRVRLGTLPATMPAEDYHLLARLDPANLVAETSETDNVSPPPSPLLHVTLPGAASQRWRNDDLFGAAPVLAG
jgi:hypothetical protein